MKRIFSFILTIVMFLGILTSVPINVSASEDEYVYTSNGLLLVSCDKEYIVPEKTSFKFICAETGWYEIQSYSNDGDPWLNLGTYGMFDDERSSDFYCCLYLEQGEELIGTVLNYDHGDVRFKISKVIEHKESDWITDMEATVYKAGSKHKECTECGEVLETATIPQLKCSKPQLKSIENTQYGVLTKWSKVRGADKYRVYRKTSKDDWAYIGSTSNTYYTDKTAKSGTKYYYALKARNEAGNSSLSNSLSKYYLADPTLKTPSSTTSGIKLSWSKVTGAEGYMVYRKTGSGSYTKLKTIEGVSKLSCTDTTAKKGTKYYYKVKAYKRKTYSAYSNTKTITDKY